MDRTEEIKELMVRLVTLLAEGQSQMREEISDLRKAVERLAENAPRPAQVPFRFKDFPGDEEQYPEVGSEPEKTSESEENPERGEVPEPEDDPEINPEADFDPDAEPEFVVEPIMTFGAEPAEPAASAGSAVSVEPADEPVKSADAPSSGVLRPRSREEQINDTSQWGMFFNSDVSVSVRRDVSDTPVVGELFSASGTVSPKEPSWMNDIPGSKVNSVYEALTNNDRFQFIRDLFDDDDEQFSLSMDRIDQCRSFGQVVNEMRVAFPDWDESSPLVYQFYMMVRRRFR